MLMRDHPPAVNLAVANGRPHPHIDLPSVSPRSADPVEVMAEGHVIADLSASGMGASRNAAIIEATQSSCCTSVPWSVRHEVPQSSIAW